MAARTKEGKSYISLFFYVLLKKKRCPHLCFSELDAQIGEIQTKRAKTQEKSNSEKVRLNTLDDETLVRVLCHQCPTESCLFL